MQSLRAFSRMHCHAALALIALAFCIKALVPAGFMVAPSTAMVMTVTVCHDGVGPQKQMQIEIPAKPGKHSAAAEAADKDGHCAFSGLSHAALGGADAILLGLAIAFILVVGLAPTVLPTPGRLPFLWPPLRGPPSIA